MARNSTEWLGGEYDLESRGSTCFPVHHQQEPQSPFKYLRMMWFYTGFKGGSVLA